MENKGELSRPIRRLTKKGRIAVSFRNTSFSVLQLNGGGVRDPLLGVQDHKGAEHIIDPAHRIRRRTCFQNLTQPSPPLEPEVFGIVHSRLSCCFLRVL